ncbi:MAG: 5-formyltetrahydrofolate cyclo-ligase [Peptoniphilaceae bacterium]
MNKKEFRSSMLEKRDSLDFKYLKDASSKIYKNFIKSDLYKNSENIFIFVSYKKEVDTHELIKYALKDSKNIFVPIVNRESKTLSFSHLKNFDDLQPSYMGILEPTIETRNIVDPNLADLVVTPGLAFNQEGYRIGYGGGFYDKFFSSIESKPIKLGIGYSIQLVDEIVHDDLDQKLDYFLSDKGLYKLGGN